MLRRRHCELSPDRSRRAASHDGRWLVLAVLLLTRSVLAQEPPASVTACDDAAQCLKSCAGDPKQARGEKLMQCLQQCESRCAPVKQPPPVAPDAGVK